MRLLIIDDEEDFALALQRGLMRDGYAVDVALTGTEGEMLLAVYPYDLLLLDLNLPGRDGMQLCQHVRQHYPALHIIMVTARSSPAQRIAGLDEGADDYLIKPFHFGELKARIRSVLRRSSAPGNPLLQYLDLVLDPAGCTLRQGENVVDITIKELRVLEYLMRHQGEVISQEMLLDHVWDQNANPLTTTVRVHIASLRRKLGNDPQGDPYIQTIIGGGYQLGIPIHQRETTR